MSAQDVEDYSLSYLLTTEEAIVSFLEEFKNDPPEMKAKAQEIADEARAKMGWVFGSPGWQEAGEVIKARFKDGSVHYGSISQNGRDFEYSELVFWSYTDDKDYPPGVIASWKIGSDEDYDD